MTAKTISCQWWIRIIIFFYFIAILTLGLSRHWGFLSSINDIGVFDQAVWGFLHNEPFLNTTQLNQKINWLGFHFHPILIVFVPLYMILPNIIWFVIAQSLALSITAWPLFLLAKQITESEKAGAFWAIAYLVNPFVLNAAAWDFHPIVLAVPLIVIGFLAIEKQNENLLIISSLVILTCKEHMGILVIGLGLLWFLRTKSKKTAIILISLAVMHIIIVLGIIMPAFSPTGDHVMFAERASHLSRYSWLGNSLGEIIRSMCTNPLLIIRTVMLDMEGIQYIFLLLIFFLGLPLMAPEFLLPAAADLSTNIFSSNPMPRGIFSYHSVCLIPILTVAALYGSKRISGVFDKVSTREIASIALLSSCIGGYFLSPLPLPGSTNIWAPVNFFNLPDPSVSEIRLMIGENSVVTAQSNIGAHFTQRSEIYRYPNHIDKANYVIVRIESPTKNINNIPPYLIEHRKYPVASLDAHLQMDRKNYIESIEYLLNCKYFSVLFWDDPWLVMAREARSQHDNHEIKIKLEELKTKWKI